MCPTPGAGGIRAGQRIDNMEDHEKGREAFESDEAYRLHCLRHSTAHIMAQALLQLHPDAKLAIGPAIEEGFYYDVDLAKPLHETDLEAIEGVMKRIVKENQTFEHEDWSHDQAVEYFAGHKQDYKLELIEGFGDAQLSVYRNRSKEGYEFVDLCKGPHVLRTGQCKHFKLMRVSGAYWRGDPQKQQLQRVYGTVWPTREELDKYLYRLEEAKKRDHRKLGKELELFMLHEWAPGAVFWLPRGEDIYNTLSSRMRQLLAGEGYSPVRTPMLFDQKLWQTSGHWAHYQEDMFHFPDRHHVPEEAEGQPVETQRELGLKPMNCPSHMLIFRSKKHSYRDLPIRIHDQGVLHRNELSGALSGLIRVRQFCQDDAHIFCTEDQIGDEAGRLLDLVHRIYPAFGMTYAVKLSTRPENKLGDDAMWDKAEGALRAALETRGIPYTINAGDGAFYGPKIDFDVFDALGRAFQCATIQLDYQMPLRFELSFVGADNQPHAPVVMHRAIFGSFERFIGILIEHFAGNFPTWLAPEQVRVMTVSEKSVEHGKAVLATLKSAGIKATFDDNDDKINYKIRACHGMRVPYMAVIGERELEQGTVSVRSRDQGDLGSMNVADFVAKVRDEAKIPF
jgi:threonyl-tRNA synthetase